MLVSVLLCTHNSRALLPIALESYLHQDWDERELVVVDDGDDPIEDLVSEIPTARYFWKPARNLAEKRNFGIRECQGEVIAHFDSDDWSGPRRITYQVVHMIERNLKVVGYTKAFWYDIRHKIAAFPVCGFWGATFCYDQQTALDHPWDESIDSCEDGAFLAPLERKGCVGGMDGGDNFVALAHGGNAERPFGQTGWEIVPNSSLPAGFRQFVGV